MTRSTLWFALAAAALLASQLPACGPPDARHYPRQVGGTLADAGEPTGTGGKEPAPRPTGGTTGSDDTGGRGGAGTGGAQETGGAGGSTGGSGVPDAAQDTGGAGGMLEPDAASPDLPGTGGATGGTTGTGGRDAGAGTGGQGGRDAGFSPPGNGTTAYCYPDPNVIAVCKQLEPACLNCPSNSTRCFSVAAAGDDKACAKYAVDNNCKVDVGGNWCGSINCNAQGCDKAACTKAQGDGVSAACQTLASKCPCK